MGSGLNVGEWELLQRNVGEWRGWFDSLDRTLQRTKRQPSLLKLEPAPSGVPLNLTLLLWPEAAVSSSPHQPPAGEPEKRIVQSFTRLDPDMGSSAPVVFQGGRCTAPPGPSSMPSSGSCMSNAVIAWCCFGMVRGKWIGLC